MTVETNAADHESDKAENRETHTGYKLRISKCLQRPTIANWIEAFCAVALVGITATYTHYAGRQVQPMRDSAKAAEDAAKAAGESVTIARDQIHTGQRAYLLIENVRLRGKQDVCTNRPKYGEMSVPLVPGTDMWLQWDVTNTGQTPAFNIQDAFRFYIGTDKPTLGDGDSFGGVRNVIGSGECDPSPDAGWIWLDRVSQRKWTTADASRLQRNERLWVIITIKYQTVFNRVEGFSSYCGYYDNSLFTSCGNVVK